jgi:hypothetical protein
MRHLSRYFDLCTAITLFETAEKVPASVVKKEY